MLDLLALVEMVPLGLGGATGSDRYAGSDSVAQMYKLSKDNRVGTRGVCEALIYYTD